MKNLGGVSSVLFEDEKKAGKQKEPQNRKKKKEEKKERKKERKRNVRKEREREREISLPSLPIVVMA
jgi:hypothetical protein